jgi:hypothetical protein
MPRLVIPPPRRLLLIGGLLLLAGCLAWPASAAPAIAVTLLAAGGGAAPFHAPLDAVPAPDGAVVYFLARTTTGRPGVFRVPATGGPTAILATGAPLMAPRGLVVSADGRTLYIADPAAPGGGAIFALATTGGQPRRLAGTTGLRPRALDLIRRGERDVLYVAGGHASIGRAAVWRLVPGDGRPPTPVFNGAASLVADGIAVTANGEIFLAARAGRADVTGLVLKIKDGVARPLVSGVRLGRPAGLALTLDEATLLVSSLARDGTAQVLLVDLASGGVSTFNDVIGANRHSGGLHRAQGANVFAWADVQRRGGGVYLVAP